MREELLEKIFDGLHKHHIFRDSGIEVEKDGSFSYCDKDFKFSYYNVESDPLKTFVEIENPGSGKRWPGHNFEMNHFNKDSFIKIRLEKKWHEVEIDNISESQTVGFFLIEFMKYVRS